jgi:aspartate/glutamate racemase
VYQLHAINKHHLHTKLSSCLHRASTVSKHFFIIPTDTHNYKITGMLKTIKIPIIAPTCFGSRRNHHQGAISCLANTTILISDEHNRIVIVVLAKHEIAH